MKFSQVKAVRRPKPVNRIRHAGETLWSRPYIRYVSLGDSIAAGHTINDSWETDYGEGSQYGKNGNTETVIVPGCYTDLLRQELVSRFRSNVVEATSFARSGDTVADLMAKLNHDVVQAAISKADYVTICIGANDVLQPALSNLGDYINYGTPALAVLSSEVQASLDILADDANSNSYRALLNKLHEINPNATYVFTTVYNPLKYLWLDESTSTEDYKDGFFGPLMWAIPDTIGSLSNVVRGALYDTSAVQSVFDRINGPSRNGSDGLAAWTETYVSKLNQILTAKISEFGKPNFAVANTKLLFESVPDRPVSAVKHYNDLVNIEFTRGFVVQDMDWGQFWANFSLSDIVDNPAAVMSNVMRNVVDNVIVPDIDPHPETYGHYVLKRSFADTFGFEELDRHYITYAANGGTGSMATQEVVGVDGLPAFTNIHTNAYAGADSSCHYVCWNTAADGSGTDYVDEQYVGIAGDMTLYAQWTQTLYAVTYRHSEDSTWHGDSDTGPMENYALYINGVEQPDLGAFSNSAVTYNLPEGTKIKVWVKAKYDDTRSYVTMNGTTVAGKGVEAEYEFELSANTDIHFEWNTAGIQYTGTEASYWNCYITTY